MFRLISIGMATAALASCQTVPGPSAGSQLAAQAGILEKARCRSSAFMVDTDFGGGNFASCVFNSPDHVIVQIEPEDEPPINCSPWYAMRLAPLNSGANPQTLTIDLTYTECGHRYWPKISDDGRNWRRLPEDKVQIVDVGGMRQASLTIDLGDGPLWLSGQESIQPGDYAEWLGVFARSPAANLWILGKSAQGRDIPAMTIRAPGSSPIEQIVLIGRQHPPEVTGAIAMQAFVEEVMADSPLASRFRGRFAVTVVPMLNPDGVVLGYWRHGTGGLDLNRDWGAFTQPETRLMQDLLAKLDDQPDRHLRLFLDFHSTQKDVFYTIPDNLPTDPAMFTDAWLTNLQNRMPDYEVHRDPGHNADLPTSKTYVFEKYGVPTATFEIGDETDRNLIKRIGQEASRAMMETLLSAEYEPPE